jgi:RHS repeat-associated protein
MQTDVSYDCTLRFGPPCVLNASRYTGKERDTESGNDYFDARYYASNLGRLMSPDWSAAVEPVPYTNLANPQSLNLYSYVLNNPLTWFDSSGHVGLPLNGGEPEQCDANPALDGCASPDDTNTSAQKQIGSSSSALWQGLKQRFSNFFHRHGFKTDAQLQFVSSVRILPNFYSASVEAGPLSQSVSYVPSTNNLYYSPGMGFGSGIAVTAGWATDPNGFSGGWSASGCFFDGIGGCGGLTPGGDFAGQLGVGVGAWGAAGGYGVDLVDTVGMGMAEGEPVDPLATKVGDVYMEDPNIWIPQN